MGYAITMTNNKFFVPTQHVGLVFAKTQNSDYGFKLDNNGNIYDIEFCGEKLGTYELEMFKSIAPYVQKGSFIEMVGEDGEQWRWIFENGTCKEIHPKVAW